MHFWVEDMSPCQADLVLNVNRRCGRELQCSSEMDGYSGQGKKERG